MEALRNRQVKNVLAVILLALGTPMLLMGDEIRRTQAGNNNAYSQDGEVSWFDWRGLDRHRDVHRFVKHLIAARRQRPDSGPPGASLNRLLRESRIDWHGIRVGEPDWSWESHTLACTAVSRDGTARSHIMLNAYWEPLEFELPPGDDGQPLRWQRWIDTALPAPDDITDRNDAPVVPGTPYTVAPRSVAVLCAGPALDPPFPSSAAAPPLRREGDRDQASRTEHYSSSSGGSGRADSRLRATKPTAVQAISRSRRTSV